MRIGIDATGFGATKTGTVTYLTEILTVWNNDPSIQDQFLIFVTEKAAHHVEALGLDNRFRLILAPSHRYWRVIWQQTALPLLLYRNRVDAHWGTAFVIPGLYFGPSVVTIHDVTFQLYPVVHEPIKRWYFPLAMKVAVRRAKFVLAVSETTRSDLAFIFPKIKNKLVVTFLAARKLPISNKPKASRPPYVLFLGTLEPRKNLERLVQAWVQIKNKFHTRLLIVGMRGWGRLRVDQASMVNDGIDILGRVDDEELSNLIYGAEFLAYPSIYEGFGLPVIEAMSLGIPVLTSNVGATREIAEGAAYLVNPHSVEEIQEGLASLLSSPELRRKYSELGVRRAMEFSWQSTARKTLDAIHKAVTE